MLNFQWCTLAGGAILLLTMIFMAVTSVGSAQFISMSSLITYDIFKASPALTWIDSSIHFDHCSKLHLIQFLGILCIDHRAYTSIQLYTIMRILSFWHLGHRFSECSTDICAISGPGRSHLQAYLKPKATGAQMLVVSRTAVAVSGLAMGALSCLLFKVRMHI